MFRFSVGSAKLPPQPANPPASDEQGQDRERAAHQNLIPSEIRLMPPRKPPSV